MIYSLSPHGIVLILCAEDERCIVWLDIDNTLYSASAGISHAMGERIHGTFYRSLLRSAVADNAGSQPTSSGWVFPRKKLRRFIINTIRNTASLYED